jgi:hypothetical protein
MTNPHVASPDVAGPDVDGRAAVEIADLAGACLLDLRARGGAADALKAAGDRTSNELILAELARRFVATRGPVTVKDLATWASLTQAQAKRGMVAIEADCRTTELDGMILYSLEPSGDAAANGPGPVVDLVQGYDEIVMSYSESRFLLTGGLGSLPVPDRSNYLHTVLCDGRLAGHWRHQLGRAGAVVEVQLRRPLAGDERAALEGAVARYGRYLGVPTSLAEPVLLA